jgi:hypothetical protein
VTHLKLHRDGPDPVTRSPRTGAKPGPRGTASPAPRDVLPFPLSTRSDSKAAALIAARVSRSPRIAHPAEDALEQAQLRLDAFRLSLEELGGDDGDRPRAA